MDRVFAFGVTQPTENVDLILQQIYLSHLLYNNLVYVERKRRKLYRKAQLAFQDIREQYEIVTALEFEAMETYKAYKKTKHLPESADGKTHRSSVTQIYSKLMVERAKFEAALCSHISELNPIYNEIDAKYGKFGPERKLVTQSSGVFWGTYLKIQQFVDQASSAKVLYFDVNGNPKKVVPWEQSPAFRDVDTSFEDGHIDDGLIAVQLQNSVPANEVFDKSDKSGFLKKGFLWIEPLPINAYDEALPRGERNKLQRTVAHMRIGSLPDGKPVWASFPVFLHRPLPEKAVITWALLIRRPWKQGYKYRWEFQLALRVPAPPQKNFGAAVAINLGWRNMDGGDLRVATWADSYGNTGSLLLDKESFRDRIRKQNDIQRLRSDANNELRELLVVNDIKCEKNVSSMRLREMQQAGVPNPVVQEALNKWLYRDNHLMWYQRGLREGALLHRREIYRLFALEMAKRYRVLIIENYDLRDIAEDEDRLEGPSSQRVQGSPSQARYILESTGKREGCLVLNGESKQATQRCNVCGCEDPWDAAPHIFHTCTNGHTWDQDINNALNMLHSAQPIIENPEAIAKAYAKQAKVKAAKYAKKHKGKKDKAEK
jgi:hypothetical protein